MHLAMLVLTSAMLYLSIASGESFCADGINILDLDSHADVVVTWAQAPLNSANGSQDLKYLSLFHTALVFRQELGTDTKYWTLEFDNTANNLLASFVPQIIDDKLVWDLDARWCLRTGIYNKKSHWVTAWEDVLEITPANFENLMYDWILDYNTTGPGLWPQYSFLRFNDLIGDTLLDDMTCSHVYRLLTYARDSLGAKTTDTKLETLKASRAVLHGATLVPLSDQREHPLMVAWYKDFAAAVNAAASLEGKFDVLFKAVVPIQFVYDPNLQQYYQVVFAIPDIVSLFSVHYERLGKLPGPPAPSPEVCDVNSRCSKVMAEQCAQGTGYLCEACLAAKSSTLIAGTCPADPVALVGAASCYCHGKCGVSDHCLEWMNKVCTPGHNFASKAACHLCLTVNIPDLLLIGGCGPLTSLESQSCFCDARSANTAPLRNGIGDGHELDAPSFAV